jgi:transcriptional regulator with XRE-family HTH domain
MELYSFGEWLRRKRKGRDLTQEGLASLVGCSASAIRKMEAEERRPSAQIVLLLAREFEIPEAEQDAFLRFARGDRHAAPAARRETFARGGVSAAPRSRLPAPPNAIIGRQKELALVCQSLVNPGRGS